MWSFLPGPLNLILILLGAFTFARLLPGLSRENPWSHLQNDPSDGAVPAIGDMNSIVWAMGKKIQQPRTEEPH